MDRVINKVKSTLNWLIRGKDGRVYVAQPLNIPILGWLIFMVLSNFTNGSLKAGFSELSFGFLAIWCYLEIAQGSAPIRRILGGVVAVAAIYSIYAN